MVAEPRVRPDVRHLLHRETVGRPKRRRVWGQRAPSVYTVCAIIVRWVVVFTSVASPGGQFYYAHMRTYSTSGPSCLPEQVSFCLQHLEKEGRGPECL
jgi:hypothetical protein